MDVNNFSIKSKEHIINIPKKIWLLTIGVILLIVLGLGGYFYWVNVNNSVQPDLSGNTADDITDSAIQGALPSIQTNPLENKPDVNPADKANPFKDIKTNPF